MISLCNGASQEEAQACQISVLRGAAAASGGQLLANPEIPADNKISAKNALSKHDVKTILLPEEYKVPNNPFEYVGEIHNRFLFRILNSKDIKQEIEQFLKGDEETIGNYVKIYLDSKPSKIDSKIQKSLTAEIKELIPNYRVKVENFMNLPVKQAIDNLNSPNEVKKFYYSLHQ